MRPLVIRSAIVASLGGLIFGFDTAVISGTTESLTQEFNLSAGGLGFTVAVALIGTIVGALTAGAPADRYGRKKMLFFIGALYVVGAVGSAVTTDHILFMIFRFLGGIGVGMASVCAPIYTAEISPAAHRGRLVGLVQFNIVLGILLAYLSNYLIRIALPVEVAWRWMFGVMALPAIVFLLLLLTVPETPRWLMSNGQDRKGVEIARRLCATEAEFDLEVSEIRASLAAAENAPSVRFFTAQHRRVILLAVAIAAFNQLSGINAILYYAPEVLTRAGASTNAAFLMSVGVGLMNLVATMAALSVIDRFGRRRLMLVGSIGYLISLGFLSGVMFYYEPVFTPASSVLVLIGLLVFIAAHAFGQGAVIWVFISEIFPNRIRGRGQSLGSLTHWVFAALTSYAFPPVIVALGGGWAFLIFFVCMIGQLIWVLKVMPETKGVPLEEMEEQLGIVHHRTSA
ncbi:MFS transporter [Kocuria dechangensis]|uniref:MFS transporter n=1 Tax=Kocuria dechangensis TaxID=1176249 RepID=A0A917H945_9MICC|nr:sugar porter family MFS transporter [Kocuria dechangensis]GGG71309.1 MFS transporter [Kocuria dechangensis]